MEFAAIQPYVRYARAQEQLFGPYAYRASDHRLFYLEQGSACITLDGIAYQLSAGDVIFWRAGVRYQVVLQDGGVLMGFNFDFSNMNEDLSAPIPPVRAEQFQGAVEEVDWDGPTAFEHSFVLRGASMLRARFEEIVEEFQRRQVLYRERCSVLLKDVLILCQRLTQVPNGRDSAALVQQVLDFIGAHYGEPIDNQTIAAHFQYHPNYISSLIDKSTGKPLHRYLLSYRIRRAAELLQSTSYSVSEVARAVGFPDIYHFSKAFKRIMGQSPKHFQLR